MDSPTAKLDTLEDQAARWLARQHSGTWSEADALQFQSWLDRSTGHRIEYLRIKNTWNTSARLKALGAGVPKGTIPQRHQWGDDRFLGGVSSVEIAEGVRPKRGRLDSAILRKTSLAASLLVLLGVGAYFVLGGVGTDRYTTAVGTVKVINLADGSRITLNTDTQLIAEMNDRQRTIRLVRGEAYFDVAKDPNRPFIVRAGNKAITAVGTAFSVRHLDRRSGRTEDSIQVTVTEGVVMMTPAIASQPPILLGAGETAQATQTQTRRAKIDPHALTETLSWRSGYINFDNVSLSEAVAEFNRYTPRKMVIDDRSLAGVKVGGNFRTRNADAFLWMLEHSFGIEAIEDGQTIILKHR